MTTFDLHRWIAYVQRLPYFRRRVEVARRIHPTLSRFLYKYRALDESSATLIDRLRDIFVRSRLWLSSPEDFNDPFDMCGKVVLKATGEERLKRVNELLKGHGLSYRERERNRRFIMRKPLQILEAELSTIYAASMAETGVFSFAGDPRNILMWSHYASDHSGICIQFERVKDFATFSGAVSVEYSPEYPEVNWIRDFQRSLRKVILRKHEGWSYEREHRIVRPGEAHRYLRFDPSALVGIILGCRVTSGGRAAVQALLEERRRAGLSPVRIFAAQKHSSRYQLIVRGA